MTDQQDRPEAEPAGTIVVGYSDGVPVLILMGEHDRSTADELSETIEEHANQHRGIVVSLSEVEFIDSSIVHALFAGDKQMLSSGRRLVLHVGTHAVVERVLDMTGILQQLTWSASIDEAVSFAAQHGE